ncbi:hypothetical protein [Streptomyces sp. NK08204]|uniref:hypothetical protein n=1 Tax=Streptomyces sp. NK08204 TaxID=2873260 RepID=UPI001CECDF96|nr:hypothetical protein [Streptomyces sp. NK08204]
MGSLRLTFCTGLLAATVLSPAAYAADDDGHGLSVTPKSPFPGSDVSLRVRGCTGPQGTAVSGAFVSDARLSGRQGTLSGETRVRSSIRPGSYDVKVDCVDYTVTRRITVVDRDPGPSGHSDHADHRETTWDSSGYAGRSDQPGRPDQADPFGRSDQPGRPDQPGRSDQPGRPDQADPFGRSDQSGGPATPVAPVDAGGGGTAASASADNRDARAAGPGTVQTVTGLVLAGIAAVAVGLRARRSRGPR